MKLSLVVAAVIVSSVVFAQDVTPSMPNNAPPDAEGEPLVHDGCDQIDTWNGTKIWAGNCVTAPPEAVKGYPKAKVKQRKPKKRKPAPKEESE